MERIQFFESEGALITCGEIDPVLHVPSLMRRDGWCIRLWLTGNLIRQFRLGAKEISDDFDSLCCFARRYRNYHKRGGSADSHPVSRGCELGQAPRGKNV